MIWSDIGIYKRDYTNGIKKIDDKDEAIKYQNEKLKHKTNAFNTSPEIDDGLEDRYTIRPFKLHYDQSLKNLFKNKTTPSNVLQGNLNLSTGTKEIIKLTNKLIPKIDHSGVDPGYYEHKLNEIKSNKDLMKREYSKADTFAKDFVADMKTKREQLASKLTFRTPEKIAIGGGGGGSEDFIDFESAPAPTHHPSESSKNNFKSLNISPIKKTNESLLEDEFINDLGNMEDELDNINKKKTPVDLPFFNGMKSLGRFSQLFLWIWGKT
jgi:hypothetical protein